MGMIGFGVEETHGMLLHADVKIKASSEGRGWTSMFASHQIEPPLDNGYCGNKDPFFLLVRNGPSITIMDHNKNVRVPVGPGSLLLNAPGENIPADLDQRTTDIETIHVYVRQEIIDDVALEMVDDYQDRIEAKTQIVSYDHILQSLMETAIVAAQDEPIGSPLFADFLSRSLAAHWIRKYSNAKLRAANGHTDNTRNSKLLAEAIGFLKEHIDKPISIEDIGKAINRSTGHVSKIFSSGVGVPPHQYLIRLRVEKAQKLLAKSSMPIAEIAYECGFSHQEHLSRLFRRHTSTTPARYRRQVQN